MTDAQEDHKGTINILGRTLTNLCKISWASRQSPYRLRLGDQCREDQADDKQHQRHQQGDYSKLKEAGDGHKLHVPALSCIWRGFKAWDTFQDSTDDSSMDKVETSLERHEHFSKLQDTTDALTCHIHLPVCPWTMGYHSRAAKNKTRLPTRLVSWCFEPPQPQRITLGLNANFNLSPSYSFRKTLYHKSFIR